MNLKYWNRHKIAALLSGVLFFSFVLLFNFQDDVDTKAWEDASESLSISEVDVLVKFYEVYERKLPISYGSLDTLTTILWWLSIIFILYSAGSALNISPTVKEKEE